MTDTVPNGYGNRLVSFAALRERHAPKMHPEYARRIFACLEAADGLVGIGGGWRSRETQAANHAKAPNTFAPPGSSFHESHPWASGIEGYAAVDVVGRHGRNDEAWNWMRDHAGAFGLCTFWNVNGEPWHVQFSDLPKGAKGWKAAGSPDPATFPLPGDAPPPPAGSYGDLPFSDGKPAISNGWHGDLVRYAQQVIANEAGGQITVDGEFGPQTEGRVKDLQFLASLATTGTVDWQGTWQFIDHLAGNPRTPAPVSNGTAIDVDDGWYWVQRGDSPWKVAERVFGDGSRFAAFDPCDPPSPGFLAADHPVRLAGVPGRTTTVAPGDNPRALVQRLYPDRDPGSLTERFLALNGGPYRTLHPGDLVFLDRP